MALGVRTAVGRAAVPMIATTNIPVTIHPRRNIQPTRVRATNAVTAEMSVPERVHVRQRAVRPRARVLMVLGVADLGRAAVTRGTR